MIIIHIAIAILASILAAPLLWSFGVLPTLIGVPVIASAAVALSMTIITRRVSAPGRRDAAALHSGAQPSTDHAFSQVPVDEAAARPGGIGSPKA